MPINDQPDFEPQKPEFPNEPDENPKLSAWLFGILITLILFCVWLADVLGWIPK